MIRGMIFGGFRKCLFRQQKFDTDTERRFAVILGNDDDVLKWLKPGKGVFQIDYRHNGQDGSYEPDFVVETKTGKYLCEPKRSSDMDDGIVLAKAKAATVWCDHATVHSAKPWVYLLIPHDVIKENKTLAGLAAAHTFLLRTP